VGVRGGDCDVCGRLYWMFGPAQGQHLWCLEINISGTQQLLWISNMLKSRLNEGGYNETRYEINAMRDSKLRTRPFEKEKEKKANQSLEE
jgi:hypothetical protein